jgi:probable rRNA maturation factor
MIELFYDAESAELPSGEIIAAMREAANLVGTERDIAYAEVSLTFESPEKIKALNREHRRIDEVTDVLSFPLYDYDEVNEAALPTGQPVLLGDIVICSERAREQADEFGHGELREFVYLFVHGLLHLLGYDHMEEADRAGMRVAEERIMGRVNL